MNTEEIIKKIRKSLNDEDWINPDTEIRQSKIGGKGLYAVKPIKKGDLVVVWGGEYVNSKQANKAERSGKLVMQWDDDLFSIEDRGEGSGYFVNHSCEPNLYMQGAYALVAMRDISKDEELTADYAIWEADENYISKWDCNCGSKSCRHKVTGKDWRLSELQEKYKNHFSPLINKRIKNN
ncbi:MAG TPA: SET domain-containing protein-lysine N-methyltransferase [Patescibacteria group bacterium]|nr:SET domain-containing protein-lysine N-methyltransferase [Patescibacteria group bacterium]